MRNKLVYLNWVFDDDQILSGDPYAERSLSSSALGVETITINVQCSDPSIAAFKRNTPMTYYHQGRQRGIYYVQSILRVGPDRYDITGTTALGRLEQAEHKGGIYTGQPAVELIRDICGPVPVYVKSVLEGIAIYGWLPYCKPPDASARDNLAQVLFAIGAYLGTDLDGVLRVEPLWDGVAGSVPADRIYSDAGVEYNAAVSSVVVTEHQYIKGNGPTTLFEGTAIAGDMLVFDQPVHDLQATGLRVLDSGANWATLSAGTGTLTGVPYLHLTREVRALVTAGATENIRSESECTLVSLANARAVAGRLADYWRCTKNIQAPIVVAAERVGHVVSIFDPFDQQMRVACISSMDLTMSSVLRAETQALVDFRPPQPDNSEYLDHRVVLTGSGTFIVPEGTTELRYALFSGAWGGSAGKKGGDSADGNKVYNYNIGSSTPGGKGHKGAIGTWSGSGGKGGEGGDPGGGSRVLEGTLSVVPGQRLSYRCGIGGEGAPIGSGLEGSEGSATIFGELSSSAGSLPPVTGWTDPITGEVFAAQGAAGLPGGDGAGGDPDYTPPPNAHMMDEVLVYLPSTAAVDEDGKVWAGAPTRSMPTAPNIVWHPDYYAQDPVLQSGAYAGFALGPGGVAGVVQAMPTIQGRYQPSGPRVGAEMTDGLTPPAPTLVPRKPKPTMGGRGGYGGGGGSCPSWGGWEAENGLQQTYFLDPGQPGPGGPGGKGGPGGDGMIVLYYGTRTPVPSGPVVTRDQRWFLDKLGRRFIV